MQLKDFFAAVEADRIALQSKAKELQSEIQPVITEIENSPIVQAVETEVKTEVEKVAPSVSQAYSNLKYDAAGLVAALRAWVDDFEKRHVGKQ